MTNHLRIGSRVQTTVGMTRHGTVVGIRPGLRPDDPPRLDVRWDDTHNEVCTHVSAALLAASSVVDALADLVHHPRPEPRPVQPDLHHAALDLEVSSGGPLNEAGRLGLGFALLHGGDGAAWW